MRKVIGIANIVDGKLNSFVYEKEGNIARKILSEWDDPEYLFGFFKDNKEIIKSSPYFPYGYDFEQFQEEIEDDLYQYDDFITDLEKGKIIDLNDYFKPLSKNKNENTTFAFKKKRCKFLRFYAIYIENNLYIITGGAIKITRAMQDHKDTKHELAQLNYVKDWLEHNGLKTSEDIYRYFDSYNI